MSIKECKEKVSLLLLKAYAINNIDMVVNTERIKKNWILWLVLGLVIVALIVATVVVFVINQEDMGEEPKTGEFSSDILSEIEHEYVERLEQGDSSYRISSDISKVYNSGKKETALGMYEDEFSKALKDEDYDLFISLLSTRSTMLRFDERCADAVSYYDTVDYNKLPNEYQLLFYYDALSTSMSCNDQQRADRWNKLVEQNSNEDESDAW